MRPQHTQVDQQFGDRLGHHRAPAIGVDRMRLAPVPTHSLGEEVFRHHSILHRGHQPSGDIPRKMSMTT